MTKWAYKIEVWNDIPPDEEELDKFGAYGWELVSIDFKVWPYACRAVFKMKDIICNKCGTENCNDPLVCKKIEQSDIASACMNEEMFPACQYCGNPKCFEVRTPEDVRALDKAILLPLCVDEGCICPYEPLPFFCPVHGERR